MTYLQVLAPVSALLGVLVGTLLSARKERRNWQRDKKYSVYIGVIRAARAMLWRGDEIHTGRPEATIEEQRAEVRKAMMRLREQLSSVEMIAKGAVVEAGRDLEGHFGNVLYPHFFEIDVADGQAQQVQKARNLLVRFSEAARDDLAKT